MLTQHSATVSTETHERIYWVMNHLSDILPPEIAQNPLGQMFLVFMREAKKDIKRLPEPFIQSISQVIGDAFVWVARGDIEEPPGIDAEIDELLANV